MNKFLSEAEKKRVWKFKYLLENLTNFNYYLYMNKNGIEISGSLRAKRTGNEKRYRIRSASLYSDSYPMV